MGMQKLGYKMNFYQNPASKFKRKIHIWNFQKPLLTKTN